MNKNTKETIIIEKNKIKKETRILVYGHMAIFTEIENLPKCPPQLQSGFSAYCPGVVKDDHI